MSSAYLKYFVDKLLGYISPASIDLSDLCFFIASFTEDDNKSQVLWLTCCCLIRWKHCFCKNYILAAWFTKQVLYLRLGRQWGVGGRRKRGSVCAHMQVHSFQNLHFYLGYHWLVTEFSTTCGQKSGWIITTWHLCEQKSTVLSRKQDYIDIIWYSAIQQYQNELLIPLNK